MNWLGKSAFLDAYPLVRKMIGEQFAKMLPSGEDMASGWIDRVLDYNIPDGKLQRGLALVHAYQCLRPQRDPSAAVLLGWAMEMLQSCFLVADDIMDGSVTRRGRPCWYKVPDVGLSAVNDALLLENALHILVDRAVPTDQQQRVSRSRLLDVITQAKLHTLLGQHLDSCQSSPLTLCTPQHYRNIVRLKTSHYTFYLPVAMALTLAGDDPARAPGELRTLCYDIGYYFQVQDDLLDCFGDAAITGKQGTDIQDGKCTWLLVNALGQLTASGRDWKVVQDNYGKPDSDRVHRVKSLYDQLGLRERYEQFERDSFSALKDQIAHLPLPPLRPLFARVLDELHRRNK